MSPDFEAAIDTNADNQYTFDITATDIAGNSVTQTVNVNVENIIDNDEVQAALDALNSNPAITIDIDNLDASDNASLNQAVSDAQNAQTQAQTDLEEAQAAVELAQEGTEEQQQVALEAQAAAELGVSQTTNQSLAIDIFINSVIDAANALADNAAKLAEQEGLQAVSAEDALREAFSFSNTKESSANSANALADNARAAITNAVNSTLSDAEAKAQTALEVTQAYIDAAQNTLQKVNTLETESNEAQVSAQAAFDAAQAALEKVTALNDSNLSNELAAVEAAQEQLDFIFGVVAGLNTSKEEATADLESAIALNSVAQSVATQVESATDLIVGDANLSAINAKNSALSVASDASSVDGSIQTDANVKELAVNSAFEAAVAAKNALTSENEILIAIENQELIDIANAEQFVADALVLVNNYINAASSAIGAANAPISGLEAAANFAGISLRLHQDAFDKAEASNEDSSDELVALQEARALSNRVNSALNSANTSVEVAEAELVTANALKASLLTLQTEIETLTDAIVAEYIETMNEAQEAAADSSDDYLEQLEVTRNAQGALNSEESESVGNAEEQAQHLLDIAQTNLENAETALEATQKAYDTAVAANEDITGSATVVQSEIVSLGGDFESSAVSIETWDITHQGGELIIDLLSELSDSHEYIDLNGNEEQEGLDTYLYIFRDTGTLDEESFVASNDDSYPFISNDGSTHSFDSYLNLDLEAGNYKVVVSAFHLELSEIQDGVNAGNSTGLYQITFSDGVEVTSIPVNGVITATGDGLGLADALADAQTQYEDAQDRIAEAQELASQIEITTDEVVSDYTDTQILATSEAIRAEDISDVEINQAVAAQDLTELAELSVLSALQLAELALSNVADNNTSLVSAEAQAAMTLYSAEQYLALIEVLEDEVLEAIASLEDAREASQAEITATLTALEFAEAANEETESLELALQIAENSLAETEAFLETARTGLIEDIIPQKEAAELLLSTVQTLANPEDGLIELATDVVVDAANAVRMSASLDAKLLEDNADEEISQAVEAQYIANDLRFTALESIMYEDLDAQESVNAYVAGVELLIIEANESIEALELALEAEENEVAAAQKAVSRANAANEDASGFEIALEAAQAVKAETTFFLEEARSAVQNDLLPQLTFAQNLQEALLNEGDLDTLINGLVDDAYTTYYEARAASIVAEDISDAKTIEAVDAQDTTDDHDEESNNDAVD